MNNIEVVSGEIEALGQGEFNLDGSFYSYIRILDNDKNVRMIKDVLIPNTVNSYVSVGTQGKFYLVNTIKKRFIFFAYSNGERNVYDSDDIDKIIKALKRQSIKWLLMLPLAILSIGILGVGLILTPMCIYSIYVLFYKVPNKISDFKLRGYLSQHGFYS